MSENLEIQRLSSKEVKEENCTPQGQTKPRALLSVEWDFGSWGVLQKEEQ